MFATPISAAVRVAAPETLIDPMPQIIDLTRLLIGMNFDTNDNSSIPRSRHDPKIGGKDHAEIISDQIAKLTPFPGDFVA